MLESILDSVTIDDRLICTNFQGQALDKHAKKSVKVLVVGNPANTNALICAKYAPSIPRENFSAMTRLDQNRYAYVIIGETTLEVRLYQFSVLLSHQCKGRYR